MPAHASPTRVALAEEWSITMIWRTQWNIPDPGVSDELLAMMADQEDCLAFAFQARPWLLSSAYVEEEVVQAVVDEEQWVDYLAFQMG